MDQFDTMAIGAGVAGRGLQMMKVPTLSIQETLTCSTLPPRPLSPVLI